MSARLGTWWWWSDWMADPALRACSYAARGLWMDCLCLMGQNKGKDYGYLKLAGRKLEARDVAQMTAGYVGEVTKLLEELKAKGVYSVTQTGTIYSRRMTRAQKNRENGRGKPDGPLSKSKTPRSPKSAKDKKKPNSLGLPLPTPNPNTKEEEIKESPPLRARKRSRVPVQIEEGWSLYPVEIAYAESKGFEGQRLADMAEDFRDYHRKKGSTMSDWSAAWNMWVRNQVKFSQQALAGAKNGIYRNGSDGSRDLSLSGIAASIRARRASP